MRSAPKLFAKLQQNPDSYKLGGGFLDDVLQHVFRCIGRQTVPSLVRTPAFGTTVGGEDESGMRTVPHP